MKKDRREEIRRRCEDIAESTFGLEFDQLSEGQRDGIFRQAEQAWEEDQQAKFDFYREGDR